MKTKPRFRYFQFFAMTVLFVFMAILAGSTFFAYTKKSGSTGLSMLQVQQMRSSDEALKHNPN